MSFVMLAPPTAQNLLLSQLRHSAAGFDSLGLAVILEAAQESENAEPMQPCLGCTSLGATAQLNGHPEKAFC